MKLLVLFDLHPQEVRDIYESTTFTNTHTLFTVARLRRYLLALLLTAVGVGASATAAGQQAESLNKQGVQWSPLEWQMENTSYSGNPFDLQAQVTFSHEEGEIIRTQMFYDGGSIWRFRFTGTRPGTWTFQSTSGDPELDGLKGTVSITPDPEGHGFVTHRGNRWARQLGEDGRLEAFLPQLVMYGSPAYYSRNPDRIERDIGLFMHEHGFTGFHTPVYCRWFDLEEERCGNIPVEDPNPDVRTFAALELLISKVHEAGGVVHIWMWGDESRTQTPKKWGLNGFADRRLQRYIAARLGPLPGWTMGYGFDLWEWVSGEELTVWHDYMHAHLGWPHMLGARSEKNRLTQLSEAMDYASYEQHRPNYETYVRTIEARPAKPAFSEDRFRIRDSEEHRGKDYSMERTRRGLWHAALAGGVANIWGNLLPLQEGTEDREGSYPYPRPDWIKTYSRFFEERHSLDLVRDSTVARDAYVLRSKNAERYIIYVEDVSELILKLAGRKDRRPVIAVDTREPYREIDLGAVETGSVTIRLDAPSDWAIAIGDFSND